MKASAAFAKAVLLEATRACVAGSAQNPGQVDVAKLQAAVDKQNAAFQAASDKFGAPNCFTVGEATLESAITVAENFSKRLCRVPDM